VPKINMVRPSDGAVIPVDASSVRGMEEAGWRREGSQERQVRLGVEAEKEYYTGARQKAAAVAEGVFEGATFGFGRALLGEGAAKRADHNPGARLVGALGGSVVGGLGFTGALRGAGALARGPLSGRALVGTGAAEGALFGAGSEVGNAVMRGDPVTASGVLGGATLGGFLGTGGGLLGAGLRKVATGGTGVSSVRLGTRTVDPHEMLGHGVYRLGNPGAAGVARAKRALQEGVDLPPVKVARHADGSLEIVDGRHRFQAALELGSPLKVEVSAAAKGATREGLTRASVSEALIPPPVYSRLAASTDEVAAVSRRLAKESADAIDPAIRAQRARAAGRMVDELAVVPQVAASDLARARTLLKKMSEASGKSLGRAVDAYEGHLLAMANKYGREVPPELVTRSVADAKAMKELIDASKHLKVPATADEFLGMTSARAEKFFGAAEVVKKSPLPEAAPLQASLKASLDDVTAAVGVQAGDARTAWAAARDALKGPVKEGATAPGKTGILRRAVEYSGRARVAGLGYAVGEATGIPNAGLIGAGLGWQGGRALTNSRALISAKARAEELIRAAAAKVAGPVGRAPARVEPLRRSLEGYEDPEGDVRELYKRRSKEIRDFGASTLGKDRAFMAATPVMADGHTELAHALYQRTVGILEQLLGALPKQPPGMNWGLSEEEWAPPPEQILAFAQEYHAATDPADFLDWAASNVGEVSPDAVEAVSQAYPELYGLFRSEAVVALSERGTDGMSLEELRGYSVLLRAPLDPTMAPEFVVAQQAMFSQPPAAARPPRPGGGNPDSRGSNPEATRSQQLSR
jgi:ParB-like chromosome segregation protein Spo0J